jgi:hypothetical protein
MAVNLCAAQIVMDGTLAWIEYVRQTVEMVRSIHTHTYRIGPGYRVGADGQLTERYWERQDRRPDGAPFLPYYVQVLQNDK